MKFIFWLPLPLFLYPKSALKHPFIPLFAIAFSHIKEDFISHLAMLQRTLFLPLAANQQRCMQGRGCAGRSVARRPGGGVEKTRVTGVPAPTHLDILHTAPSANCFTHIDPYFIVINMIVNLPSTCIHSSALTIHDVDP
jgi:hypothetical protein